MFFSSKRNTSTHSRPALIVESGQQRSALHVYAANLAKCHQATKQSECTARRSSQKVFANSEEMRSSADCTYKYDKEGELAFSHRELNYDLGELWNEKTQASPVQSDISLLFDAHGAMYPNLDRTKAFELQIAALLKHGNGIKGMNHEVLPADFKATSQVLYKRCQNRNLREVLADSLTTKTPFGGIGGVHSFTPLWRWSTLSLDIGGSEWWTNTSKAEQRSIHTCIKILQAVQSKAQAWSASSKFDINAECGHSIEALSDQACMMEAWKGTPLKWAHVTFDYKLAAQRKDEAWLRPSRANEID